MGSDDTEQGDQRFGEESDLICRELERCYPTYENWTKNGRPGDLASFTGAVATEIAMVIAANRYMDTIEAMTDPARRSHRCGWCWRAAGGTDAAWKELPKFTPDEAGEHTLACQHNPLVREIASLRSEVARLKDAYGAAGVDQRS